MARRKRQNSAEPDQAPVTSTPAGAVTKTYTDDFGSYTVSIPRPQPGEEIPWIVDQLMELATFDATDVVAVESGRVIIRDTAELTPAQRRMIKSIKQDGFGAITIAFHDRLAIIDRLAKQFGALMSKEEPQQVHIHLDYGAGLKRP